jgi:hypothetical protein
MGPFWVTGLPATSLMHSGPRHSFRRDQPTQRRDYTLPVGLQFPVITLCGARPFR